MQQMRKSSGLSLTALGEKAGVHRDTIFLWEHDKIKPKLETLELVASAMGISVAQYVGI